MSRSLKKGPFADASLLKKVDALNAAIVCPTKDGKIVERRDHVLITDLSFAAFSSVKENLRRSWKKI